MKYLQIYDKILFVGLDHQLGSLLSDINECIQTKWTDTWGTSLPTSRVSKNITLVVSRTFYFVRTINMDVLIAYVRSLE